MTAADVTTRHTPSINWAGRLAGWNLRPDSVIVGQPEFFRQQVEARSRGSWVVVDEVQRLPAVLNEVHALISETGRKYRFALSGSSARKLKRLDVISRSRFPTIGVLNLALR